MLELQYHDSSYFVTLTYDDLHVPKSYYPDPETGEAHTSFTLCKRDFQLWMKRLRKKFSDDKIRFFACGEYGGQTKRPHYHVIVFGLHLNDLVKYKTVQEGDSYYTYYNSDSLQDIKNVDALPITPELLKGFGFDVVQKSYPTDEYEVFYNGNKICELWVLSNSTTLETPWQSYEYFHEFMDYMYYVLPKTIKIEWKGVQS